MSPEETYESLHYDVIRSHSVVLLSYLIQSRVLLVDLPYEILSNILGFLVDCDRKEYDNDYCDIHGFSSVYRALQLSSVSRAFRSALLDMRGAWAVVTSSHPGEAFLTMCIDRSSGKGLQLYLRQSSNHSTLKLLRNLVRIHPISRVRIVHISVEVEAPPVDSWSLRNRTSLPPEEELVRLLGKLDISTLFTLDVHYAANANMITMGRMMKKDPFNNEANSELEGTGHGDSNRAFIFCGG